MPVLTPENALNNAYKKDPIERADIDKFKKELIVLLDNIKDNPNESEEHHKKNLASFLQKTWYDPDYYINTSGYIDMVIHNGSKSKSPIGVIIETKKPGKNSEMVSKDNLNVKSMQQLLLYFLRDTIDNNNLQIKHLIITNMTEWFIFDAREFYRFFLKDSKLVEEYRNYKTKGLFADDTSFFYQFIASPSIDKIKSNITFTHIDLNNYGEIIRNQNKEDDTKIAYLYKYFPPNTSCENSLQMITIL